MNMNVSTQRQLDWTPEIERWRGRNFVTASRLWRFGDLGLSFPLASTATTIRYPTAPCFHLTVLGSIMVSRIHWRPGSMSGTFSSVLYTDVVVRTVVPTRSSSQDKHTGRNPRISLVVCTFSFPINCERLQSVSANSILHSTFSTPPPRR